MLSGMIFCLITGIVGLNAQNIGSGTGGNLEYKKFK